MVLAFNEGKCCDAVLKLIEARTGSRRSQMTFPENEGHTAPIELTCSVGGLTYALEHTGIEPFAGHVEMSRQASWRFAPIEQLVAGRLPSQSTYELGIPIGALTAFKGKALAAAQEAIAAHVIHKAPSVPIAPYGRYLRQVRSTTPAGVPFPVRLDRFQTVISPDRFIVRHSINQSVLDAARRERLKTALDKKLPKLAAWQARTILILEDNDVQLTDVATVFDTLENLRRSYQFWPTEIYLVSSISLELWFVSTLLIDGRSFYDLADAGIGPAEMDPASLTNITGRP